MSEHKHDHDEEYFEDVQIIDLTDEEGNVESFEFLMTLTHEENDYVVLIPYVEDEDYDPDAEEEVVIMQLQETDDEEEDLLLPVENPVLLDEVFQLFLDTLDEMEEDGEEAETEATPK